MLIQMSYAEAKRLGSKELLRRLQEFSPERRLFSIKTDWEYDSRFGTTAKGGNGDIGIKWDGQPDYVGGRL